jgi:hypothetical protein
MRLTIAALIATLVLSAGVHASPMTGVSYLGATPAAETSMSEVALEICKSNGIESYCKLMEDDDDDEDDDDEPNVLDLLRDDNDNDE